jgi:hypothetical protein
MQMRSGSRPVSLTTLTDEFTSGDSFNMIFNLISLLLINSLKDYGIDAGCGLAFIKLNHDGTFFLYSFIGVAAVLITTEINLGLCGQPFSQPCSCCHEDLPVQQQDNHQGDVERGHRGKNLVANILTNLNLKFLKLIN